MNKIRLFIALNGIVAAFLLGMLLIYVVMIILISAVKDPNVIFNALAMPTSWGAFVFKPWTLVTYVMLVVPQRFISLLFDGFILYTFAGVYRGMVGEEKTRNLLLFGLFVTPLLVVSVCTPFGYDPNSFASYIFGLQILMFTMIGAAITLAPMYPIRFFFFEMPIVFAGLLIAVLDFAIIGFVSTANGTSILVAMVVGALSVVLLRQGINVTDWLSFGWLKGPAMRKVNAAKGKGPGSAPIRVVKTVSSNEQEELDKLLDKVLEVGYDKLSRNEKERLEFLSGKNKTSDTPPGPGPRKVD